MLNNTKCILFPIHYDLCKLRQRFKCDVTVHSNIKCVIFNKKIKCGLCCSVKLFIVLLTSTYMTSL